MNRRISAGWGAFHKNKEFFTSKRTTLNLKWKLCVQTVLPAFIYGCECWTMTKSDWHKVEVAYRKMLRKMVGVNLLHRRSNDWLLSRIGAKPLREIVEERMEKWARRLAEMEPNRWPSRILTWTPYDRSRKPGRPAPRWRDPIAAKFGINWLRKMKR